MTITISHLPDDILEIIKYKTIDMNRELGSCDKEGGKYWREFHELFDDVLNDIDNMDTEYMEDSQEEDESLTRVIFNSLYWDELLTPVAYEKEHKRIYPHEDVVYDNIIT